VVVKISRSKLTLKRLSDFPKKTTAHVKKIISVVLHLFHANSQVVRQDDYNTPAAEMQRAYQNRRQIRRK
jgi:hypothetical protein